jgi:hypothetical protein
MAATSPQDGDLLVRSERGHQGQDIFVITAIRALWETTCHTYHEAVHVAERTARAYNADIWFTRDGHTFELIASFRDDGEAAPQP